ncbi:class I adenylate-forming enzyme family protein [Nocardioides yefusunii]|uniref:Class I adenylate-forming enzyme family protein n=1 Tax=Nocardioides yefusunii TaxID=2500546 RepID=A0ABW1QWR3_9ACTN|nr:class I adenylate-forming enzyme family protein [Nocardioides yefusunii]
MPEPTDVADLAALAATRAPDRLALVEAGGRSLTFAALDEQVSRFSTGLGGLGVVGGQRVMLVLGNRIEFVVAHLGALRAHAVSVPVDPRTGVPDLAWMIADSGAALVVADAHSVATVRAAVALVRTVVGGGHVDGLEDVDPAVVARARDPRILVAGTDPRVEEGETAWADVVATDPRPVPASTDPERLAALLYTVTAAGRPRAAMLTHRALLANLTQFSLVQPATMHGDDVVLGLLPLHHVYGLNAVLGSALWHRAKVVLVDQFHPETTLDVIDDEAVSVLPVAPPVIRAWLGHPGLRERLGPVRLVLSGSELLPADVAAEFAAQSGLPVHQGYGLTEGAPVVTTTLGAAGHSAAGDPAPGSFGAPLPGVEIGIVDDATGRPARDEPGRLRIRGENLFSGYWPDGTDGPDADGWWDTGDVGWTDENDELHLVDRARDVIVVSGFNVYPSEVEEVVATAAGVRDCAVVGAADPTSGQSVVAYVVLAPNSEELGVRIAITEVVREQLARFKQPSRVEFVDRLPTTGSGRVARGRLRGMERRRAGGLLG